MLPELFIKIKKYKSAKRETEEKNNSNSFKYSMIGFFANMTLFICVLAPLLHVNEVNIMLSMVFSMCITLFFTTKISEKKAKKLESKLFSSELYRDLSETLSDKETQKFIVSHYARSENTKVKNLLGRLIESFEEGVSIERLINLLNEIESCKEHDLDANVQQRINEYLGNSLEKEINSSFKNIRRQL